jgi:hypothetical protein
LTSSHSIAEGVRAMFDRDVSDDRDWWAFARIVSYDPELWAWVRSRVHDARAGFDGEDADLSEGRRWLLTLALACSAACVDVSQVLGDEVCDEVLGRVVRAPAAANVVA